MDREKQVGTLAVGDRGALRQRHELVGAAREDHVDARHLQQQRLEPKRDVEHEVGLGDAFALRARVVAAVAGIDDDPIDAEPELPRHRKAARKGFQLSADRQGRRRRFKSNDRRRLRDCARGGKQFRRLRPPRGKPAARVPRQRARAE